MTMRPRVLCCAVLLCTAPCGASAAPPPPVAVVDDGERVPRTGDLPGLRGERNPVWTPGGPVRLFGLPGETVAFQVVVTAEQAPLRDVTVELASLEGPVRLVNAPGPRRFQPIERFVVAALQLQRRSGGRHAGESLGWERGAMPPKPPAPSAVADPLIPVELAPPWADYPMTVAPGEHRAVWIDLTLPDRLPAGAYRGTLVVRTADRELARLPLQLEVGPVALPYAAVRTMVYYDPQEIRSVTGSAEAVRHYLQLMHRHHLSTIHRVDRPADVAAQREELSGTLFTAARGYDGPGAGRGVDVVAIGSYGSLGMPTPERLRQVEETLRALDQVMAAGPRPEVFLYAVDEQCDSPLGPAWRDALRESTLPAARQLLVAQTCSRDPALQRVDLALVHAGSYDPWKVARARELGRRIWIYNGLLPRTGSFLTDGGFLSLRVNGWLQVLAGIERWFYWESTFWNDDNRGGKGPYDPLLTAETFHNHHGDWANGDGVLVYPGQQLAAGRRSLHFAGVLPSLRLKQWRRGISDAGYLLLCKGMGPEAAALADREAQALLGPTLRAAGVGPPAWSVDGAGEGAAFFAARRRLFEQLVRRGAPDR